MAPTSPSVPSSRRPHPRSSRPAWTTEPHGLPALVPAERSDELPLSYAQQRLWLLHRIEGPGATYNIPAAWRLTGALDRDALAAALDDVAVRHESLRTVFPERDGRPRQVVLDQATVPLHHSRVTDTELPDRLAEAAARGFDIDRELRSAPTCSR